MSREGAVHESETSTSSSSSLGAWTRSLLGYGNVSNGLARFRIAIQFGTDNRQGHASPSTTSETPQEDTRQTEARGASVPADVAPRVQAPAAALDVGDAPFQDRATTAQPLDPGLSSWIERNTPVLGLLTVVFLHHYMVGISWLWRTLILLAPITPQLFWDQFFALAVADLCIRLLTAFLKAAVLLRHGICTSVMRLCPSTWWLAAQACICSASP
ncbi:hypothetical protein WJX73_005334 [Symbiochloris irregularis]|uniref:Uncharacterized protein n=1 Tax=Symbiochloris irregularis TaxID=706552 RepID=A0AAW1PCF7_9CHLO